MGGNAELATWLVSRRREIEREMSLRLGPAAPAAADPESEALRRFRSFAASALRRGDAAAPAMEGVRAHERRVLALLRAWTEAAEELAGERGRELRGALDPLVARFRLSLRTTRSRQRASGQPRASRRAVVAAIDRVADAFFAVDTESGEIADANPAAGALLGVARDALLGVSALSFVADEEREVLWGELDAVCESDEPRHFRCALRDRSGTHVPVEASATAFTSRGRTLALLLARPLPVAD